MNLLLHSFIQLIALHSLDNIHRVTARGYHPYYIIVRIVKVNTQDKSIYVYIFLFLYMIRLFVLLKQGVNNFQNNKKYPNTFLAPFLDIAWKKLPFPNIASPPISLLFNLAHVIFDILIIQCKLGIDMKFIHRNSPL